MSIWVEHVDLARPAELHVEEFVDCTAPEGGVYLGIVLLLEKLSDSVSLEPMRNQTVLNSDNLTRNWARVNSCCSGGKMKS